MNLITAELNTLIYWIGERESIRRAKEAGKPRPWTTDPLLRDYRWCNVSRMDDRVSRELMHSWYDPAGDRRTLLVAATLGRLVNWPEALLEATRGRPFRSGDLAAVRQALHGRAVRGEKVFTGAYVVPGVPGRNKVDSTLDVACLVEHRAHELLQPTLRMTWTALTTLVDGIGSFLAGQIGADLAQLPSNNHWIDRLTFAPVGPGSARGMNRLRGRPKNTPVSQGQFEAELDEYIGVVRERIPEIHDDRKLCAQDYQSTLCEFDKYRRLQLSEGQVRARYNGAQGAMFA